MAKPSTTDIVFLGRDITVDFHYYPATRGYRNSYGAPEEPDEPAEVEVEEENSDRYFEDMEDMELE